MSLPFTIDQFLGVFRQYNETVWPLQWALNFLAVVAVAAAVAEKRRASNVVVIILAFLWIWTGVAYHLVFFRPINPAATLFGALFLAEGMLIAWLGLVRRALRFERRTDLRGVIGYLLIFYGLIAYPAIGYALGHRYPAAPTFGVPCPTTIFTFGMILLSAGRPWALIVVPVLWSILGMSAALQLEMWEDLGLVVAAVVSTVIVIRRRAPQPRADVALART